MKGTKKSEQDRSSSLLAEYDLETPITRLSNPIELAFTKGNKAERLWNELVDRYHYLGHKIIVGRCIKYLVTSGDALLGAVAFSSPAWGLAPRDAILSSLGVSQLDIPNVVINNCRFLILPHVRVHNLASTVLSLATNKIVVDWAQYYALTPMIAETFVEPSRFLGTCYKAANWVEVGESKGYAKKGGVHRNSQEPKRIYLYGLNRNLRRKLFKVCHEIKSPVESRIQK